MTWFKLPVFALLLAIFSSCVTSKVEQKVYIKATRCNVSEKFFYNNFSCYAKSYSRTFSASFVYMVAKAPITSDLRVSETLFYKYGLIFRDVIRTPAIEICTLVHDLKHNLLSLDLGARTWIDIINGAAPGLVHECPYYSMSVRNASWDMESVPSVFPSGEYKLIFSGTIKGEFAGAVNVNFLINSTNKDTFGISKS